MTTYNSFNLNHVDPSWTSCLTDGLKKLDQTYINNLLQNQTWLPGIDNIFNAFSLPVQNVNYVLFGESPYPRKHSANGYAFWDASVSELWSESGLSKKVNRATSLRNIIKMLLVAENALQPTHMTQSDIAKLNKDKFVQSNNDLFKNFLDHGFLLLNATLVLQPHSVRKDALIWHPFVKHILEFLFEKHPHVQLILFGKIANTIDKLINHYDIKRLYAEHPYNLSFITNSNVIQFFQPFHLLMQKNIRDNNCHR